MSLYDVLKAAKVGAAPDVITTLRAQIAPFAKGGSTPTPAVKELEDAPPLSFTSNGQPLLDWNVSGASGGVGDRTSQLFDIKTMVKQGMSIASVNTTSSSAAGALIAIPCKAETTYTVSIYDYEGTVFRIGISNYETITTSQSYTRLVDSLPSSYEYTFTTTSSTKNILIQISNNDDAHSKLMVVEDSTAAAHEPYGYEITVTCGSETKTIYLDEPLGVSDSISMTDTGISIPTVKGSNTLAVGTTVQPSKVYIKYKE